MGWFWHVTGLNGHGRWNQAWAGILSAGLISGSLVAVPWHFLNCHDDGCKRLGRFTTVESNGHHYRRCRKHHGVRHAS